MVSTADFGFEAYLKFPLRGCGLHVRAVRCICVCACSALNLKTHRDGCSASRCDTGIAQSGNLLFAVVDCGSIPSRDPRVKAA